MGTEDDDLIQKMGHSRETLLQLIAQWNANRLDLFEISIPNAEGEFHGVMRFYFQEAGAKVATKCIRVASSATAKAVIETLVEKFRPDMRMLSIPEYAVYEIHENGEERKLEDQERPLLVQLNWHSDDREGRFLLRRIDEKTNRLQDIPLDNSFKRKLSKREKKQLKKSQEKKAAAAASVAEKLYTELPETSFTRSISNPEAVMRRRRQQKLEKKLAQFRSRDGGPDTGGTLKIYGESLCRDVPYKTLLLSVNDTAVHVVKEMLAKYGIEQEPQAYCLVQVCDGEGESILDDDESPLSILMNQQPGRGSVMFHVRRRPSDYHPRKRKKKAGRRSESGYRGSYDGQLEPLMVELLPDGSETGRRIALESDVTEVGSDWGGLQLNGLRPRHCVISNTGDGFVTLTPSSRDSDIYVNGQRIYETTAVQHGAILRFGRTHYFRFEHRGRSYSEREVAENSQLTHQGDGQSGRLSQSPPLSPSHHDENMMSRSISGRQQEAMAILPATLELPEAGEEGFLTAVIVNVSPSTLQFKLAPTYSLYLAARYRATTHFRYEVSPHERAHLLSTFLLRVAHILMQMVQERNTDGNLLAFWMANASELLHFLKSDRQIGAFSLDAQDVLAEIVQLAFRHLVTCIQAELSNLVGLFMHDKDEEDEGATAPMMAVLSSGMTLLRRCRVNAALTIQLFSQLFHFINMAIFNKLIGMDGRNYCSRTWGNRIRRRLNRIEMWAEKQGLELAADCHLVRVVQAAHLLQAPKNSGEEVATAAHNCFKLNSLQLRCLLMKYQYESDEIPISADVLENVIRVAESTVDEVIRADGRHVRVEEEPLLGLAFLLPEDGYSCDIVRGVPSGLIEFLTPLLPFCRLTPNPSSAGYWTIFFQEPMRSPSAMSTRSFATMNSTTTATQPHHQQHPNTINFGQLSLNPPPSSHPPHLSPPSVVINPPNSIIPNHLQSNGSVMMGQHHQPNTPSGSLSHPIITRGNEPEVQMIKLHKMSTGLGLSIVAAKGVGQDRLGIYIKSVVKGGSADKDGRLAAGDQLLTVDGQSLVGITQERAAEYLVRTGPIVSLEVAKQAAIYQGLATMLSQPSPVLSRDSNVVDEEEEYRRSFSRTCSSELPSPRADGSQWAFGGGIGNLRSAQSEGNLSRVMSLEALSRRGLSESALGVPRVIGSSRLLKFFLPPPHCSRYYEADLSPNSCFKEFRSKSLTTTPWGLTAPRRMSERDLPSKVLREQNQELLVEGGFHHGHPLSQSRIQASKSVPSLNSDSSVEGRGMAGSGMTMGDGRVSHVVDEVRSPVEPSTNSRYARQYPANNFMTMPAQRDMQMQQQHHPGAPRSRSIQSLTDPVHRPDIGSKQPSTPALHLHPEEDRFYQNLAYYAAPPPPPVNPANIPVRTYIPYSNSTGNIPSNQSAAFRSPHHSQPNFPRGPIPNLNTSSTNPNGISQQLFQQQQQWQRAQQLQQQHPAQLNQNLLRQEAKMLEMQDELRRREERTALMMNKAQQNYPDRSNQRFTMPPSRYMPPQTNQSPRLPNMGPPPPPAPKPYRSGMEEQPPGRPPLPDEYRHSVGELPRGTQTFTNKNPQNPNSPWEREEKERELQRRIEVSKYWRDQQIHELEMMGPSRNAAQDEQLKSLRMEREFQRRAEELNRRDEEFEGGDPEDDEEDERKVMVKRIQEDLERTRLNQQNIAGMNGIPKEDERAKKIEEMRRKKAELEATQAAEERLVREAQKRREQEEVKRQSQLINHQQQFTSYQQQQQPLQYRSSYPPKIASPTNSPAFSLQDAPPLPKSPPPALYRGQGSTSPEKSPVSPPQSSPTRAKPDKKTVSFNETVDTNEPSSPSPSVETERVREDPNLFLSEATAMLSSPRSPDGTSTGGLGNTPGVIGSQEVYRDPRWRRLAEQQQQQNKATPKPEKLTFKEKMKMFAMESGEANTPKDKVKTSRAQREIEIPGAPPTNNNNEEE